MADPRLTPERIADTADDARYELRRWHGREGAPEYMRAETILALIEAREACRADVHPTSLRGQWEELRRRRLELEERDAKLTAENERLREGESFAKWMATLHALDAARSERDAVQEENERLRAVAEMADAYAHGKEMLQPLLDAVAAWKAART